LRPDKRLGQNFLMDDAILARIVAAAEVAKPDTVLEVGAGLGSLTRHLGLAAQRVVAVELDANLIPILREVLAFLPNVEVVQGNILSMDLARLGLEQGYLVVANIPYYITSSILRRLLEQSIRPARLVLTVQREVAQRICAKPGEMSLLALSVQVYGLPSQAGVIPAGAFYPSPKVDSAIVKVELYSEPVIPAHHLDGFFRMIKAGFSQKRKTLRNTLSAGLHTSPVQAAEYLGMAGIDPQRRAETLSLEEWNRLVEIFPASGV
jgi:16S rRNA (adenine1518-N6/adenine1519-N6)-dimethyltransferase